MRKPDQNQWMKPLGSLGGSLIGSIWGPIGRQVGSMAGEDFGEVMGNATAGNWDGVMGSLAKQLEKGSDPTKALGGMLPGGGSGEGAGENQSGGEMSPAIMMKIAQMLGRR